VYLLRIQLLQKKKAEDSGKQDELIAAPNVVASEAVSDRSKLEVAAGEVAVQKGLLDIDKPQDR